MIRRLTERDVPAVHALYAACHPTWPAKPQTYWWAHPTLVLFVGNHVRGATSFVVSPPPAPDLATIVSRDSAEMGWGNGVYVHPAHQGRGLGWELAQARHAALEALGVHFFLGMTQPDNVPMLAIFERQGLTRGATVPRVYPSGEPGVIYSGKVT